MSEFAGARAAGGAWAISPNRALEYGAARGPLLMAIVNVTPDSFSDGGETLDPAAAVVAALRAVDEGADLVDLGGESTRPGAARVPPREQIRRVVPVISGVRERTAIPISIDTTSAEVAKAALDAGADIVNDTSAGLDDPTMFACVAQRRCGVVLMHRRRSPSDEQWSHEMSSAPRADFDPVDAVRAALDARVSAAIGTGIDAASIAVDPGLGFGKTVRDNFAILDRLDELVALGRPVLVGASRKSFIGAASGVDHPRDRLAGSLAAAILAAQHGAAILRVHDVAPHRQALAVLLRCGGGATMATHRFAQGEP